MFAHPQVHVGVGVIVHSLPRPASYRYLSGIAEAGYANRFCGFRLTRSRGTTPCKPFQGGDQRTRQTIAPPVLAFFRLIRDYRVTYYRGLTVAPAPATTESVDDAIWSALNDASRRRMLDLLRGSSMTTGQLGEHFDLSRFAVMKHLKVLEKAALVISSKVGRERINHLNPVPLQQMYRRWIKPYEELPADRLIRVKQLAEQGN